MEKARTKDHTSTVTALTGSINAPFSKTTDNVLSAPNATHNRTDNGRSLVLIKSVMTSIMVMVRP